LGEIVTGVKIKKPASKYGCAYSKLGRYQGEDLAQATVAVLVLPNAQYRVAFGSVAPTPLRAFKIENLWNGHEHIDADLIEKAKLLLEEEIAPISDVRASKEYRMHMSKVMLERTLKLALERFAK
jgi:carbon-monoxide dehydrogenase medium subunit